ncbi:unknown [Blautia sp. CAG:237]|uniref:hypothetical protein n=1 Tax=Blautia sp. CAG:237 TaxID=1262755 RepID=UPI000334D08F|nr:hypothetical protein [Blautia sp. CAG:237]CDB76568.1 unknown [Blautia sp. CAG:237]
MNNTENDYLPTDLGNVSLNPRGEYDPETAYEYLDTVSYQGGSYVCRIENGTTITGTAPEPGRNTDIWQMLTLPGNLRPDYIAMHDDVVNKAAQVEISRAAVEQAQQEVEAAQADVQQLHEDTVQTAQEAENSRDSAAGYAQSAEASRKAAAESEQNINAQMTGLDQKVSESVIWATGDIATARQQAIDTITTQEAKSTAEVKRVGTAALDSAKQASQDIKTAGQQAVRAITDQQNISVQAVKDETKNYIEEKKQEISDKTNEVTQAVKQAGEKQLQDIANSLDNTLTESGKAADSKAVGDAIALIEENKANKSALATTDRKLDALWKLNQGISYEFQTDNTEAYQKEIPTGAKMASVKSIGGKTIVWNQLLKLSLTSQMENGCTVEVDENKHIKISGIPSNDLYLEIGRISFIKDHIYFINVDGKYTDENKKSQVYIAEMKLYKIQKTFVLCDETKDARIQIAVYTADTSVDYDVTVTVFDLTKMFGAGNEPSTVKEFEAMFPAEYYPRNEGTLLSMSVNEVVEQGNNLFDLSKFTLLPGTIKFIDDVLIANDVNYEWFSTGINGTAKAGDVISYEVKTGTAVNVRFKSLTPDGYKDITPSITSSEWKEVRVELPCDISRLCLNWKTGGSFSIRNFRINGEKYKDPISYQIPQTILDLPGYGWSAGNVTNEVDWENKKYIQRVAAVDLGSLNYNSGEYENHKYFNTMDIAKLISPNTMNTLCKRYSHATANAVIRQENMEIVVDANGQLFLRDDSMNQDATLLKEDLKDTVLYYELAEPIVTNIAEIIPEGFLEAIEVEPGGSLTFQNSNGDGYKVPVPNTVEYVVKLSEVGGTTE